MPYLRHSLEEYTNDKWKVDLLGIIKIKILSMILLIFGNGFGKIMKKKKVILNISALPIWTMGEGKGMPSIYEAQVAYIKKEWDVYYIFSHPLANKNQYYFSQKIHFFNFKVPFRIIERRFLNTISANLYWISFTITAFIKGLFLAFKVKPNIIYAHTPYAGLSAFLIAKYLNIPIVFRGYGTSILLNKLDSMIYKIKIFNKILTLKLPYDKLVLTDDGTGYDRVVKKLGVSDEKILFLRNGINKNIYIPNFNRKKFKQVLNIEENNKILLSVSRLVRWKKVDRMIKAMPKLIEEYPNIRFLIIGDGPERKNLENLRKELKMESFIKFLGALPHTDLKNYYNLADIFVSMYDLSNVGNPLLEAMMSGKCIITLNNGFTARLVQNNYNGVILEYEDLPKLPQVIGELLKDEERRKYLGANARKFAEKHFWSWEKRMNMEIGLVEKLIIDREMEGKNCD